MPHKSFGDAFMAYSAMLQLVERSIITKYELQNFPWDRCWACPKVREGRGDILCY